MTVWLVAPPTPAPTPPDITIVSEHEESAELERQLRAEIAAADLSLEGHLGTIVLLGDRVLIHMGDRREVVLRQRDEDLRVTAMQIVDIAQALADEESDTIVQPIPPSPSAVPRVLEPRPGRWTFAIQPGVRWAEGGLSPHATVGLSLAIAPHWAFAPVLGLSLPISPALAQPSSGRVVSWAWGAELGLRVHSHDGLAPVRFECTATAGVGIEMVRGHASSPYQSKAWTPATLVLKARPALSVRVSRRIRWRLEGFIGGQFPRLNLEVAKDELHIGPLMAGGTTGFEGRWGRPPLGQRSAR